MAYTKSYRLDFRFPRLKRRGPIEAPPSPGPSLAPAAFPRLKRRGPIEARFKGFKPYDLAIFPRLKRRGPIEATHIMWIDSDQI